LRTDSDKERVNFAHIDILLDILLSICYAFVMSVPKGLTPYMCILSLALGLAGFAFERRIPNYTRGLVAAAIYFSSVWVSWFGYLLIARTIAIFKDSH